jgi:hypothetical protein
MLHGWHTRPLTRLACPLTRQNHNDTIRCEFDRCIMLSSCKFDMHIIMLSSCKFDTSRYHHLVSSTCTSTCYHHAIMSSSTDTSSGYRHLVSSTAALACRSLSLPKRRFWKEEQTMKSGFSTDFSTISSPNPVLTPLKSASFEIRISSFLLLPKSSFGRDKLRNAIIIL